MTSDNPVHGKVPVPVTRVEARAETLGEAVTRAVQTYLVAMEEQTVDDLYELVLTQVERPLLECAMRHTGDNQSRTAQLLGVSRGTLRSRLKKYRML